MAKGLECPYCNKHVLKFWKLFIFPPLLIIDQSCMHCQNQVRLNWHALFYVIVAIVVASIVGILVDKIYSFESILFDIAIYIIAAYLPFLLGQKLFLKS